MFLNAPIRFAFGFPDLRDITALYIASLIICAHFKELRWCVLNIYCKMQCTAYWLVFHIKHCIVILSHIAFASASPSIVFPSASSPGDTSLAPPRNITTLVTSSSSAGSMPRFVKVYQRAFCFSVGKIIFTPSHFPPGGICALCSLTWTNLT